MNVVDRFRSIASQFPEAPAIRHAGTTLSYAELDHKSDALAHGLIQLRGPAKEPVALLFRHGSSCCVTLLAILKCAKFYAGIDQDADIDRQVELVSMLGTSLLLCDPASHALAMRLQQRLPMLQVVDVEQHALPGASSGLPAVSAADIACIVFTSGSTGAPKGVVLSQHNLLFTALLHGRDFEITSADRALHICPLWTAAATSEIFSALLNAALLIPFDLRQQGIGNFGNCLDAEQITTLTAAPALFRVLLGLADADQQYLSVRLLRLGGDRTTRADFALFKRHFGAHCRLRLGYGSSEYLPVAQLFVDPHYEPVDDYLPIGYPMTGCELALQDAAGAAVPLGAVGEIVVSSEHLCSGYWRNAALTARQFRTPAEGAASTTYFTNDLAFMDESGCLHFVGRKDSVAKIHGKLVALASIERALVQIEWIQQAAVVAIHNASNGAELVAFLVTTRQQVELADLRARLADTLLFEAMPTRVIVLPELPFTANNKLDSAQLKRIASQRSESATMSSLCP